MRAAALAVAAWSLAAGAGCGSRASLTDLVEARRLAAALHVDFSRAAEAANRAVMADTDEASVEAAGEARAASADVEKHVTALRPILRSLAYEDEQRVLEAFIARYAEFQRIDAEMLPLAVENTNLKAQRRLFGPARTASGQFRSAVDEAARAARPPARHEAESMAARGGAAVLEMEVLLGHHIAEADDAEMTRLEEAGARQDALARAAVARLDALVSARGTASLAAARSALDAFAGESASIVALSRRNTNVRSLALSLGRKRMATVQCEEQLRGLETALHKHEFTATR
jgi:hypothetical protein